MNTESTQNEVKWPHTDTSPKEKSSSTAMIDKAFGELVNLRVKQYTSIFELHNNSLFDYLCSEKAYCKYSDVQTVLLEIHRVHAEFIRYQDTKEQAIKRLTTLAQTVYKEKETANRKVLLLHKLLRQQRIVFTIIFFTLLAALTVAIIY